MISATKEWDCSASVLVPQHALALIRQLSAHIDTGVTAGVVPSCDLSTRPPPLCCPKLTIQPSSGLSGSTTYCPWLRAPGGALWLADSSSRSRSARARLLGCRGWRGAAMLTVGGMRPRGGMLSGAEARASESMAAPEAGWRGGMPPSSSGILELVLRTGSGGDTHKIRAQMRRHQPASRKSKAATG